MQGVITRRAAPTCIWMDAGVLTFKLCDRDFDCAHCPLNAALKGSTTPDAVERACRPAQADRARAPEDAAIARGADAPRNSTPPSKDSARRTSARRGEPPERLRHATSSNGARLAPALSGGPHAHELTGPSRRS